MVQHIELCLQWPINRKSYMTHRTASLSMTLNDPYPGFKVTPFLTLNISETVQYTDIVSMEYK